MFSLWGFCGIIVFYILDFCFVLESVFQYCFPWKSPIQECIWFGKMIMTSRVDKISFSSSANVRGSVVLHQTMCCSGWLWFWRIFDWLNKNVFSSVGKSQFFFLDIIWWNIYFFSILFVPLSPPPPHTLFILSVLVLDGQILESFNCGTFFRFDLKQRWNILRSLEQILNPLYSLF